MEREPGPGVAAARAGLALAFLLGCGEAPAPEAETPAARPVPYQAVADMRETMVSILEPAADVVWDSAGFVITAEGETDLSPTTEAGWAAVRDAALLVAETGNLLMLPERARSPAWIAYATSMREASERVIAAAEARDAQALFDAGGVLYLSCRACHDQYMGQPIAPPEGATHAPDATPTPGGP